MANCIVCGVDKTWAGSRHGTHKICLSCHRKGYKFGRGRKISSKFGEVDIINPKGKVIKKKRIKL